MSDAERQLRRVHALPCPEHAECLVVNGQFFLFEIEVQSFPRQLFQVSISRLDERTHALVKEATVSIYSPIRQVAGWNGRRLAYFSGDWSLLAQDTKHGGTAVLAPRDDTAFSYTYQGDLRGARLYARLISYPDEYVTDGYLTFDPKTFHAEEFAEAQPGWQLNPETLAGYEPSFRTFRWSEQELLEFKPLDEHAANHELWLHSGASAQLISKDHPQDNPEGAAVRFAPIEARCGPDGFALFERATHADGEIGFRLRYFSRAQEWQPSIVADQELYGSGGLNTQVFCLSSSLLWIAGGKIRIYSLR